MFLISLDQRGLRSRLIYIFFFTSLPLKKARSRSSVGADRDSGSTRSPPPQPMDATPPDHQPKYWPKSVPSLSSMESDTPRTDMPPRPRSLWCMAMAGGSKVFLGLWGNKSLVWHFSWSTDRPVANLSPEISKWARLTSTCVKLPLSQHSIAFKLLLGHTQHMLKRGTALTRNCWERLSVYTPLIDILFKKPRLLALTQRHPKFEAKLASGL